jgi:hypothetical protein
LHEIEVPEQTNPHHTKHHMQPTEYERQFKRAKVTAQSEDDEKEKYESS